MFESMKRCWLVLAIVASLIGGGLSWPSASQACTVSKPANVTATVNEQGIELRWDAPPEGKVGLTYEILRGVGAGATPTLYMMLDEITPVYDAQTGTYRDFSVRTDWMDYDYDLEAGQTYVYAVVFGRVDSCGDYTRGEQSDSVTVTYQPKE